MTDAIEHKTWSELSATTQAALRCKEPVFWAFLRESGFCVSPLDEESAARVVRSVCQVESRRDLAEHSNAQAIWHDLDDLFQAWKARER